MAMRAGFRGLRLTNTLTRTKDEFVPFDPSHVRMYVCGPTVYDFAHIGNARPVIVFDVLFRLLRHLYGAEAVTYARNVTDVDDKINLRAHERGQTIRQLTDGTLAQFRADVADLGCLPPTIEPRATDHIEEMKAIIERLIAAGVAYVAEDHVLFDVKAMERLPKVPRYGALARRSLDDMLAGARVDIAPYKRDPMDFVLWKPSREAHEPGWPSPAGIAQPGRPGWHIECSAMAWKHLVDAFAGRLRCEDADATTFDIHGGGIDLTFPHHENENAQSCCAFGIGRMAQVWMHNGFLQVEGEKMSKSLGNFVTIREVLKDWPGEVARLTMLKTHYRQPIDWTLKGLKESASNLKVWREKLIGTGSEYAMDFSGDSDAIYLPNVEIPQFFTDALLDDLNTPLAISKLHHLSKSRETSETHQLYAAGRLIGIFDPLEMRGFQSSQDSMLGDGTDIAQWVEKRNRARALRDWQEADNIRKILEGRGVILKDAKGADGQLVTTWEIAR